MRPPSKKRSTGRMGYEQDAERLTRTERNDYSRVWTRIVGPIGRRAVVARWAAVFRFLPSLPLSARRGTAPHFGQWPMWSRVLPRALRSYSGIRREADEEDAAFKTRPLQAFQHEYKEELEWAYEANWRSMFREMPRIQRAIHAVKKTWNRSNNSPKKRRHGFVDVGRRSPKELSDLLNGFAAEIGLSAIGVAKYDPKMTFKEFAGRELGDRVVVCILEQNFDATQTIPSLAADRATWNCIAEVTKMSAQIAEMLRKHGYRARAHDMDGEGVSIAYAVEAGLGQLGLNGQLLTPFSGPRCRITMVSTDAPLIIDKPVDFGIPKICDNCRACVRRCPSKALTSKRLPHRGVEKAKVVTARCLPVLQAVDNCGICMKVCPVQRYGLGAVVDEFEQTGTILGKGTDELEGYKWPLDGQRYGPGRRPPLGKEFYSQRILARLPGADARPKETQ